MKLFSKLKGQSDALPFHKAVSEGDISALDKAFRKHGVEQVNRQDDQGCTALHIAAMKGNGPMVRQLLLRGGDPAILDEEGRTPLHIAVHFGHVEVVKDLLKSSRTPRHLKDKVGRTAFDYAANRFPNIAAIIGVPEGYSQRSGNPSMANLSQQRQPGSHSQLPQQLSTSNSVDSCRSSDSGVGSVGGSKYPPMAQPQQQQQQQATQGTNVPPLYSQMQNDSTHDQHNVYAPAGPHAQHAPSAPPLRQQPTSYDTRYHEAPQHQYQPARLSVGGESGSSTPHAQHAQHGDACQASALSQQLKAAQLADDVDDSAGKAKSTPAAHTPPSEASEPQKHKEKPSCEQATAPSVSTHAQHAQHGPHGVVPEAIDIAYDPRMSQSGQSDASSYTDAPAMFLCPITREIMLDPVVAADGHTYERAAIKTWLLSHPTSPVTNLDLEHSQLTPNIVLRAAIIEWKERRRATQGSVSA